MSRKTEKQAEKRSVGRPRMDGTDDRRERLMAVAGPIFSRQGFAATRIAEIAEAADVTPAMVHYYFGGKEGLLEAVFEDALAPVFQCLDDPGTLEEWVILFHGNLLIKRWMPHLMMREVMMEGGHLRALFLTRFAPRISQKWLGLLTNEKSKGNLRADANELRHMVMFIGMLIHPFAVAPLSGPLTGMPFSDEDMIGFRDDALRLFFKGAKG